MTWQDGRNEHFQVYVQRLSAAGQPLWDPNGLALTSPTNDVAFLKMISDGAGGAILGWEDNRNYFEDIFVQRVDAMGAAQWISNGVALTSLLFAQQDFPSIATDGAGGAIVTWRDDRSGELDIFAGRVSSNGVPVWGLDGVPVCTLPTSRTFPRSSPMAQAGRSLPGTISETPSPPASTCIVRDWTAKKLPGGRAMGWRCACTLQPQTPASARKRACRWRLCILINPRWERGQDILQTSLVAEN